MICTCMYKSIISMYFYMYKSIISMNLYMYKSIISIYFYMYKSIISMYFYMYKSIISMYFYTYKSIITTYFYMYKRIISIVKPTRCTNVSNLFYFGITLYMFRTVFPSIIRSSRLYMQQQAFVKQIQLSAFYSICLTYGCCCMYSLELLMMDGKTVRNM